MMENPQVHPDWSADDLPDSVASEALDTASGDLSSMGLTELKDPSPPGLSGGAGWTVAVARGLLKELRMDGCSTTMPFCSCKGKHKQQLPVTNWSRHRDMIVPRTWKCQKMNQRNQRFSIKGLLHFNTFVSISILWRCVEIICGNLIKNDLLARFEFLNHRLWMGATQRDCLGHGARSKELEEIAAPRWTYIFGVVLPCLPPQSGDEEPVLALLQSMSALPLQPTPEITQIQPPHVNHNKSL